MSAYTEAERITLAQELAYLPAGWTEAFSGGLATKLGDDGGIVDTAILTGQWFAIPNDGRPCKDVGSRAEGIRYCEKRLLLVEGLTPPTSGERR